MKLFLPILIFMLSACAWSQTQTVTANKLLLGTKTAPTKSITFQNNLGVSNTSINSSLSGNDLQLNALKVKVGTGAVSSSPELQFSVGAVSSPAFKYDAATSKIQFSHNGSTFQNVGSEQIALLNIVSVSSSYTVPTTVDMVLASGAITVTLPNAASQTGKVLTIKNTSTRPTNTGVSNAVVLIQTVSSQLIDGVSASTSLVNFGESVDLVSDGSTWYYKDIDARVRKFAIGFGGVSEFLPCGTVYCSNYNNTGAVSAVINPGATTGLYQVDLLRQTCRSKPVCSLIAADNVNYQSAIPNSASSSTAFRFNTGTGAANNAWGTVTCMCDRW